MVKHSGLVTMHFQDLYMSFTKEGYKHTLKGLKSGSHEIITSHCMEKLLKKGHSGIIAQFNAIQVVDTSPHKIHPNLQLVLTKHKSIFDTTQGLSPSCGEHDHGIPLISGSQPPNVHPVNTQNLQHFGIPTILDELGFDKDLMVNPFQCPVDEMPFYLPNDAFGGHSTKMVSHSSHIISADIKLSLGLGLNLLKIWQGSRSGRFETFPAKYQVKWTCIYA